MKYISSRSLLGALTVMAGLMPLSSQADHKVTVYRDLDGDGHYNKKKIEVGHSSRGNWGHGSGYYGRPYYAPGYAYSRPYYSPGYAYPRPYYGSSFGFSYYSAPRTYVYREVPSYSDSDDLAVDVQRALRRRGYYSGPADGAVGPGTRAAIRAYQADRGFPVTGRIDSRLVRSLGLD